MKYNMTGKKFSKKYPHDEWEETYKGKTRLMGYGNLKKWMSVKYYGHRERLSELASKEDTIV